MEKKKEDVSRIEFEMAIIFRAWKDPKFLADLREDPKQTLAREFGARFPQDFKVELKEEDESTLYLVVPPHPKQHIEDELSDKHLSYVAGGMGQIYHPPQGDQPNPHHPWRIPKTGLEDVIESHRKKWLNPQQ